MTNIIPGNWKLVFRICLWSPKPRYKDRYPSVCTNSPTPGSGFCAHHAKVVGDLGYPTKLRPFLSHCGADPDSFTKEGKKKVTDFIQEICKKHPSLGDEGGNAENLQGMRHMLQNPEIAKEENLTVAKEADSCKKDLGEKRWMHNYSRGIEQIVGGGLIIEYWNVIFVRWAI